MIDSTGNHWLHRDGLPQSQYSDPSCVGSLISLRVRFLLNKHTSTVTIHFFIWRYGTQFSDGQHLYNRLVRRNIAFMQLYVQAYRERNRETFDIRTFHPNRIVFRYRHSKNNFSLVDDECLVLPNNLYHRAEDIKGLRILNYQRKTRSENLFIIATSYQSHFNTQTNVNSSLGKWNVEWIYTSHILRMVQNENQQNTSN